MGENKVSAIEIHQMFLNWTFMKLYSLKLIIMQFFSEHINSTNQGLPVAINLFVYISKPRIFYHWITGG